METETNLQEIIVKQIMGDYWEEGLISTQITGTYYFTSKRISFKGGYTTSLDLPYEDMKSATLCNVGPFIKFLPTGILITMKNGKKYRISILKRKEYLMLIQANINKL